MTSSSPPIPVQSKKPVQRGLSWLARPGGRQATRRCVGANSLLVRYGEEGIADFGEMYVANLGLRRHFNAARAIRARQFSTRPHTSPFSGLSLAA